MAEQAAAAIGTTPPLPTDEEEGAGVGIVGMSEESESDRAPLITPAAAAAAASSSIQQQQQQQHRRRRPRPPNGGDRDASGVVLAFPRSLSPVSSRMSFPAVSRSKCMA